MVAVQRSGVQRAAGRYHADRSEQALTAYESQNRPDPAAPLQRLVGRRLRMALVLCSIRTRYTADPELYNNANPSRSAKTKTCSGTQDFGLQDSGTIMQQSLVYSWEDR